MPTTMNDKIRLLEQQLPMDVTKLIISLSIIIALFFLQFRPDSPSGVLLWSAVLIYALLSFGSLLYRLMRLKHCYRQRP